MNSNSSPANQSQCAAAWMITALERFEAAEVAAAEVEAADDGTCDPSIIDAQVTVLQLIVDLHRGRLAQAALVTIEARAPELAEEIAELRGILNGYRGQEREAIVTRLVDYAADEAESAA